MSQILPSGTLASCSFGCIETRRTMVATEDIGNEVARQLVGDWSGKKIIELGNRISPDDLARAMSEVLGRPVQARSIPREQWTASPKVRGVPPGFAGPFEEMEDAFNSGWIEFGVPGTDSVAGKVTPAQLFTQARKLARVPE